MITGDNWGTANAIGKEVGISTVIAKAKPEEKAEKVKELQVLDETITIYAHLHIIICPKCI